MINRLIIKALRCNSVIVFPDAWVSFLKSGNLDSNRSNTVHFAGVTYDNWCVKIAVNYAIFRSIVQIRESTLFYPL